MSTPTTGLSEAARAIRALEAEFQRLANANDAAGIAEAFFADDACLQPPNTPQVNGKAAIREFWKAFLAAGLSNVTLETGDVYASGDLAYNTGKYGYTAGGERHEGKYLVVHRRQADGSYKAVADTFTSNK